MASDGITPYPFLPYCKLKLLLTLLSSCLMSVQPPSSANLAFLLACKSIPILPYASFSLVYPTHSAASCLLSDFFSLLSSTSTHSLRYYQSDLAKMRMITPLLTDPPVAPVTCHINFMSLCIPYKILYGLAPLPLFGVISATPPFTFGYTILQLSLIHLC